MAVGGAALAHEVALACGHLAEAAAGGGDGQEVDGVEEFLAAQPAVFVAGHGVGEELVAVAGAVGGGDFTGLLFGGFELRAVAGAVLHGEGVVEVDADNGGAGA